LLIREGLQQKVLQIVRHTSKDIRSITLGMPVGEHITATTQRTSRSETESLQASIDIVAIGSSTGGPPALQNIFSSFEHKFPFAVVVSQHMPAGFTRAFAERLNRSSLFDIKEAEDGDQVIPGRILIAPGGMNMVFEVCDNQVTARIVPPGPADRYVPSVDVMLESCAGIYRKRMIAVILTGMGNDGSKGIRSVHTLGGYLIAESEETSVVYGMPREAVATGLIDRIVPLHHVVREILIRGEFH
jgi:two-component system chemotaxis response regulator CheB